MKTGSFSPHLTAPTLHALSSDDVPLYFDMANLTPKQQADHMEMCVLVSMLQTCLFAISKPEDYIAVFDGIEQQPFKDILKRYHAMMRKVGLSVVPLDHLVPASTEHFYQEVAENMPDVDIVNFLMVSRSNENIHGNASAIDMILKLNSKYHFAQNAPAHGIPVPESLTVHPPIAGNADAQSLFARHNNQIMMKLDGMPGGRNVMAISSAAEADKILQDVYPGATEVVLQHKLNLDDYDEWTVDLLVTDTSITIDNTRHILIADGNWVGNHIPPHSPLSQAQEDILIKVGEYAQSFGYGSPEGSNMGIDYFIGKEGDVIITEINPRWTAGLLPSEVLKRIGKTDQHTIAYFDMVKIEDYDQYLNYIETRLPGSGERSFEVMPIGFSPFDLEVEGQKVLNIWLIVRGDFKAFRNEVREQFSPGNFPVADLIPLEVIKS
jgi:hypothetical protein